MCVDERALRYLGRDGAIDINGPAGDKLRGGVVWETIDFEHTKAAAADGSTSQTPRWIVSNGGSTAGPTMPRNRRITTSHSQPAHPNHRHTMTTSRSRTRRTSASDQLGQPRCP